MRVAIIDIGTNTINLLVADIHDDGSFNIIQSSKNNARIGKGCFSGGILSPEAIQRGLAAIGSHILTIESLGHIDKVVAIGTSALRCATNASEFIGLVKEKYGFDIKIISGEDEARLIFDGVKQVQPIGRERVLILDIGGGSCEFVIANKDGIIYAHSFELGVTRLLDMFPLSDPVTQQEIRDIEAYLRTNMAPLFDAINTHPTFTLIGTSGSFDIAASLVAERNHPNINLHLTTSYEIPLSNFDEICHKILESTNAQRAKMLKFDPLRNDVIVPGIIIINFVLRELRMESLYQCGYALKQGAIYQLAHGNF